VLEDRKNAYDCCGVGLTYNEQAGQLKYFNLGVYSQVAREVIRRLDKAFQNFFRRVKNGEKKVGYPRFQGKNRYDSFKCPQSDFKIKDGKLHLSKIGMTRIFRHREIEGNAKTCKIKQYGSQWYACFAVELLDSEKKEINTSAGVDIGITTLVTLSDGTEIENPKTPDKHDSKLRKAHRCLSQKKSGSSNWNKQKIGIAGVYRKVRNARKDYLHKSSRILADAYNRILFEDLQIKNMVKNHHLARSLHGVSRSILIGLTTYKAEEAGGIVEMVNPINTSKQCPVCGCIQSMPLSQRTYQCPDCGAVMSRDHNVAINIKNRYVRADCPELTPVKKGCMSNRY